MAETAPKQKSPELKLPSLLPFFSETKKFLNEKVGMGKIIEQIKSVTTEIGTSVKAGFTLFEKIATPAFLTTVGSLVLATTFWPLAWMASPFFLVPTVAAAGLYGGGAFDSPAAKPAAPAAAPVPAKK